MLIAGRTTALHAERQDRDLAPHEMRGMGFRSRIWRAVWTHPYKATGKPRHGFVPLCCCSVVPDLNKDIRVVPQTQENVKVLVFPPRFGKRKSESGIQGVSVQAVEPEATPHGLSAARRRSSNDMPPLRPQLRRSKRLQNLQKNFARIPVHIQASDIIRNFTHILCVLVSDDVGMSDMAVAVAQALRTKPTLQALGQLLVSPGRQL
ncbi:hypothetical protein BS17DRAFT_810678 [Gyrodon lividus]|nr:hypothetical protein BS17DRAFT_810678 [Gyrodon lividus]